QVEAAFELFGQPDHRLHVLDGGDLGQGDDQSVGQGAVPFQQCLQEQGEAADPTVPPGGLHALHPDPEVGGCLSLRQVCDQGVGRRQDMGVLCLFTAVTVAVLEVDP